jgi:hypothetical protein
MKRSHRLVLWIAVFLLFSLPAASGPSKDSVGLGVSIGASFPQGHTDEVAVDDWDGSFNWGFYVNIPLIYTFHLTPSAELYQLNKVNATDISLAFKFIIPLGVMDLYFGFVPGLTTVGDNTIPNVGALVGGAFNLVSNLDIFVEAKYKFLFEGDQNMRVLHANAGILFHF